MGFNHWQHFTAYKVDWIDMKRLQSIIADKARDIKNYVGKFDEHWLLLVSNIGTKASANQFDFLNLSSFETEFQKVYVFKDIENEIFVIK